MNIFGGIMRCDVIANGVVAAARQVGLAMPLVVRLEGTNVEQGNEILARAGSTSSPRTTSATPPKRPWRPPGCQGQAGGRP